MKTLKQLWKNHKKALSDAFSYIFDEYNLTSPFATKVGVIVRPTLHT